MNFELFDELEERLAALIKGLRSPAANSTLLTGGDALKERVDRARQNLNDTLDKLTEKENV